MRALSQASEYALRALTFLALHRGPEYCLVRDMSERLDIPPAYLVKVLQPFVSRGMLESRRGRRGGYRLATPAPQVSLADIVEVHDHLSEDMPCVLGQATCSDERACPLHDYWKSTYTDFRQILSRSTLDDVVTFCRTQPGSGYPG